MKIKCMNPIAAVGLDLLPSDQYELTDEFNEADAVLVRSASMHDLEMPKQLLAIARAGAGVNNIPLDRCAEQGIVVFNSPGANANGVKEAVLAGLLLGSRDYIGGNKWVESVKDDPNVSKLVEKEKKKFAGHEIKGKKIGVIGLGAVGVLVANACIALGMEVYGYDPFISVKSAWNLSKNIKHISNVDDIYRDCDYITVHVPLMDSTRNTINKDAFDKMKDGVVILNFARDPIVNDDDMEQALKSGKVRKYVTDFPNTRTAGMEGVIAIPHLGASTQEAEDNCAVMACRELRDFSENGNIVNSVNYPACTSGPKIEGVHRITVCHKNIPTILGKITSAFRDGTINIENMINKSRKGYAYTIIDVTGDITDVVMDELNAVDGVIRIRVID